MRQVVQHFKSGLTEVVEAPAPALRPGQLLIRTHLSLVSAGTERMLVEFGRASLIGKARQQPDKVAMVLEKARTDGVVATLEAVTAKLDEPIPLGYCNVGTVIAVGAGVAGFQPGDRVASNGPHAEIVRVPVHLCARVPSVVADDTAVFTVTGSIALQGIRLLAPTLGETIVVTGLGLIGLVAVQLLRANGCRVIGIDMDRVRLELAHALGAEVIDAASQDPAAEATAMTAGSGVDGVLIAAATDSDRPVTEAARMSRQRGRIVLVGVTGLELSRADFYAKELTFQVSCSYGPGRNDPGYEEHGHDYPIGFVRWTEQRNFTAVLEVMAAGGLRADRLITHRVPIINAAAAYKTLLTDRGALGILLTYDQASTPPAVQMERTVPVAGRRSTRAGRAVCSFVGAGNYASRILIPTFAKQRARLRTVVTGGSVQGVHAGRKFGFEFVSTDVDALLQDSETSVVVVTTRHDSHAELAVKALAARKHVFVEKPLALTRAQIDSVRRVLDATGPNRPVCMVGFNRRFAPLIRRMAGVLASVRGPRAFIYTVNAGAIPPNHWTQDRTLGGGRIVGEACHFIDLLRYLAAAPIAGCAAQALAPAVAGALPESATISLRFANGDLGTIHYLATGHRSFPKERLEVFAGGAVLQLDNFRRLNSFGWPGMAGKRTLAQDKGQSDCVAAFLSAVEAGGGEPIPLAELFEVAEVTLRCAEALEQQGAGR